jgi:hypothetical protein
VRQPPRVAGWLVGHMVNNKPRTGLHRGGTWRGWRGSPSRGAGGRTGWHGRWWRSPQQSHVMFYCFFYLPLDGVLHQLRDGFFFQ